MVEGQRRRPVEEWQAWAAVADICSIRQLWVQLLYKGMTDAGRSGDSTESTRGQTGE